MEKRTPYRNWQKGLGSFLSGLTGSARTQLQSLREKKEADDAAAARAAGELRKMYADAATSLAPYSPQAAEQMYGKAGMSVTGLQKKPVGGAGKDPKLEAMKLALKAENPVDPMMQMLFKAQNIPIPEGRPFEETYPIFYFNLTGRFPDEVPNRPDTPGAPASVPTMTPTPTPAGSPNIAPGAGGVPQQIDPRVQERINDMKKRKISPDEIRRQMVEQNINPNIYKI